MINDGIIICFDSGARYSSLLYNGRDWYMEKSHCHYVLYENIFFANCFDQMKFFLANIFNLLHLAITVIGSKNLEWYFSYFSQKTGFKHFMQIISSGDYLHKMSKPVSK